MADNQFDLGPNGGLPTQQALGPAEGPGGVVGVQYANPRAVPQVADSAADDVGSVLGGLLLEFGKGAREGNAQAGFLEGIRKVSQGAAIKDVIDETPWYSTLFGNGADVVNGARTMGAQVEASKAVNDLYTNMPDLQKVSPQQIQQVVLGRLSQISTGDAESDVAVLSKLSEQLPAFYKAHLKANVAYQQGVMQTAFEQNVTEAGTQMKALSQRYADRLISESDFNLQRQSLAESLKPLPGQSLESYQKIVSDSAQAFMAEGNFHAYRVIKDAGLLSTLRGEEREKLANAEHTYTQRLAQTQGTLDFGPALAVIDAQVRTGQLGAKDAVARYAAINDQWRMRYGVEADLVDMQGIRSNIGSGMAYVIKRQNSQRDALAIEGAKANAKMQQQAQEAQLAAIAFNSGNAQQMVNWGTSKKRVDSTTAVQTQAAMQAGKDWATPLVHNYNSPTGPYVNEQLKGFFTQGLRASEGVGYNPAFQSSFDAFQKMSAVEGGQATAMAYFGEKDGATMLRFQQAVTNGMAPEQAYQFAANEVVNPIAPLKKKDAVNGIREAVRSTEPGVFQQLLGSANAINEQGLDYLADVALPIANRLRATVPGMDDSTAMSLASSMARKQVDLVGGYVIPRGTSTAPLAGVLPEVPQGALDDVFHDTLVKKIGENGGDTKKYFFGDTIGLGGESVLERNHVSIQRMATQPGQEATFFVSFTQEDGASGTFYMSAKEMHDAYNAKNQHYADLAKQRNATRYEQQKALESGLTFPPLN